MLTAGCCPASHPSNSKHRLQRLKADGGYVASPEVDNPLGRLFGRLADGFPEGRDGGRTGRQVCV